MASASLNSALSHFCTCSEQTSLFTVLWHYSRQKMSTDSASCIMLQSNLFHVILFFRHIKFSKMVATAYPKQVAWHYAATLEFPIFFDESFPILEAFWKHVGSILDDRQTCRFRSSKMRFNSLWLSEFFFSKPVRAVKISTPLLATGFVWHMQYPYGFAQEWRSSTTLLEHF